MSVLSALIGLQASAGDGEVTSQVFLDPLEIQEREVVSTRADCGAWASGMIVFATVCYDSFAHVDTADDAGAQSEAFAAGVADGFMSAASFLDKRSTKALDAMRAAGLELAIFISVDMDQDQMELVYPSEFVVALSRHRLGIHLISNDF